MSGSKNKINWYISKISRKLLLGAMAATPEIAEPSAGGVIGFMASEAVVRTIQLNAPVRA